MWTLIYSMLAFRSLDAMDWVPVRWAWTAENIRSCRQFSSKTWEKMWLRWIIINVCNEVHINQLNIAYIMSYHFHNSHFSAYATSKSWLEWLHNKNACSWCLRIAKNINCKTVICHTRKIELYCSVPYRFRLDLLQLPKWKVNHQKNL